jgi:uncharacterized protein (TIGR03435 family)
MSRLVLLVVFAAGGLTLAAQSDAPRFEVASVKPSVAPPGGSSMGVRPGGVFSATNRSVLQLIRYAYGLVADDQVVGGPGWIRNERFTVSARAAADVPRDQFPRMVQTLLAERFKLRATTETRELPIYELRRARSDGRLGPNLHDCSDATDTRDISTPEKPFVAPRNGAVATADCAGGLTYLVTLASSQMQSVVVDRTGLTGQWRFHVYFASEPTLSGALGNANPDLASFATAMQEQLGLRLQRARGPAPVVVIESVERPAPD